MATIPDELQIHGYTAQRRAETNSLLDMVWTANALHRQEGGGSESIKVGGQPWQPKDGAEPITSITSNSLSQPFY